MVVTEANNQATVDLRVGQTLAVHLGRDFRTPTVSGPALEQVSARGGYPSEGPLSVIYRAVGPGSIDITTSTDYRCRHVRPACARPTTLWTVHVKVTAAPPPSGTVTVYLTDDQSTVTLKVGDSLQVVLPGGYSLPSVTPQGILALYQPDLQFANSKYLAVKPGQADLTSISHNGCYPESSPCPRPSYLVWALHVKVTA